MPPEDAKAQDERRAAEFAAMQARAGITKTMLSEIKDKLRQQENK